MSLPIGASPGLTRRGFIFITYLICPRRPVGAMLARMNTRDFLLARKTAVESQITDLENALEEIATGAQQSYSMDTGQGRVTVTKLNLSEANRVLDSLYNRHANLCNRLDGDGVLIGRGAW